MSAFSYIDERLEVERLRRAFRSVFTTVDVVVTPTVPILAVPITEARDDDKAVLLSPRITRPFNIYGLPAISVPCGFSSNGLPVVLQIVGPAWQEESVLRLARAYALREMRGWKGLRHWAAIQKLLSVNGGESGERGEGDVPSSGPRPATSRRAARRRTEPTAGPRSPLRR